MAQKKILGDLKSHFSCKAESDGLRLKWTERKSHLQLLFHAITLSKCFQSQVWLVWWEASGQLTESKVKRLQIGFLKSTPCFSRKQRISKVWPWNLTWLVAIAKSKSQTNSHESSPRPHNNMKTTSSLTLISPETQPNTWSKPTERHQFVSRSWARRPNSTNV